VSLSVVIPAYNSSNFIVETLGSVLRQTLAPREVLVIDDGSTDDTAAIAESFGSPVRVIRRWSNSGQGTCRNFGVQIATSEWIAFVDADDVWEPDKLEKQIAELARYPGADVCYTGRVEYIQNGRSAKFGRVLSVAPAGELRESLFRNTSFLPSSVVIRRSIFLQSGGFDTRFTIVEDWDLWLRLLHAGTRFVACDAPLVWYRIHPNSVSRKALVALDEKSEIYRRHVVPHLPTRGRSTRANQQRSEHESCAAYTLRDLNDPRCLRLLACSIARSPFYDPIRYLALGHMLYTCMLKWLRSRQ